ncbi:MAG: trp operon repressor [Holosporaceae bacterium]|jgi:TrpR-related protein YerC/YecD|nr:trp operon repressor [Holosporaceae bacterium]
MKTDRYDADEADLLAMFSSIESPEEARDFLLDLCTPSEIRTFVERWKVCRLLSRGTFSYRDIKKLTGASLTTIGRVARFLKDEPYGGYRRMLQKIGMEESK